MAAALRAAALPLFLSRAAAPSVGWSSLRAVAASAQAEHCEIPKGFADMLASLLGDAKRVSTAKSTLEQHGERRKHRMLAPAGTCLACCTVPSWDSSCAAYT